jgi:hypothetical protein
VIGGHEQKLKGYRLRQKYFDKTLSLYISKKEYEAIKRNADLCTEGNVSAWLRFAGQKYKPKKKDLLE